MPLVLDTHETNSWISHISEDARKYIVIISPFLKINERLRRTIQIADSKGVKLFVIYGKKSLDEDTNSWIKSLKHSNLACIPHLHAKLYMNEEFIVISSMNLYEFSQVNNEELGVLMGRKEDRAAFKDSLFHVMRLIDSAEKEYGSWNTGDMDKPLRGLFGHKKGLQPHEQSIEDNRADPGMTEITSGIEPEEPSDIDTNGATPVILCHCIRCNRTIPSDHEFIYCGRCMDSWQRYCNMRYVENEGHCYICGESNPSCAERPSCISCYRDNSDLISTKISSMRDVRKN